MMKAQLKNTEYIDPYIFAGLDNKAFNNEFAHKVSKDNSLIIQRVCEFFHIKERDIKGKKRTMDLVVPRQIAIYMINKYGVHESLSSIGSLFGNRHHSTILYSVEIVETMVSNNKEFRSQFFKCCSYVFQVLRPTDKELKTLNK